MAEAYIRLEGVGKVYDTEGGAVEACVDVNLEIRESEFVAIVGPSGCGKTTIMKMVAGLVPHSTGSITVGGRRVDRPQTDVGIVFQESILLDWRDVLANVMLQVDIRRLDRALYEPVARRLLLATGLQGFVTQPDGTNIQGPVYLSVDPDTHEVLGYLDPADVPTEAPTTDAAPDGGGF